MQYIYTESNSIPRKFNKTRKGYKNGHFQKRIYKWPMDLMIIITNHQRNANENHNEESPLLEWLLSKIQKINIKEGKDIRKHL